MTAPVMMAMVSVPRSADAVTSQVPPQSRMMIRVALGGLLLLPRLPIRSGGAHGGRKSHCA
eukprot:COSAG01_NODE_15702_length_1308_cov_1.792390_1_plen_60_part_10